MNIILIFIVWVGELSEWILKGIFMDIFIEMLKVGLLKENNELRIIKKGNVV